MDIINFSSAWSINNGTGDGVPCFDTYDSSGVQLDRDEQLRSMANRNMTNLKITFGRAAKNGMEVNRCQAMTTKS